MSQGWSGRILRIDLSKMASSEEDVMPYARSFVGGRGINVKMMYDEVDPKILPFDPGNRLYFGPGVLTGTLAPGAARMKVTSMSPNGLLANSGIGGWIGCAIRYAGYDNVIIQGKADKPVYVYIHDDSVQLKDASHIWGKDTYEAQQIIRGELGGPVVAICIGTAGENLVSFGNILTETGNAAGRGGFGAIMGSKNLKAIAVRGTRGIRIAKLEEFNEACWEAHRVIIESPGREAMVTGGDRGVIDEFYNSGMFVLGNWEEDADWLEWGRFGGNDGFFDQYTAFVGGCFGCPSYHMNVCDIGGTGLAKVKCVGWLTFSGPVWNNDRAVMVRANYLCNKYGIDVASTGNIISFLMELYHRGIMTEKDTDGISMRRGDKEAIISAINKIGKQEGFGRLFKDGVLKAAKTIGKEAENCAMHVKGLEMQPYEVRAYKSQALTTAVATRDIIEGHSDIDYRWVMEGEEMEKWAEELYGTRVVAYPTSYEKKGLMDWDHENRHTAVDMLGLCKWHIPWFITTSLTIPARLFSLATGVDLNEDELLVGAQRTRTLERAFNVAKGIRRKDDTLPKRLFETAAPGGVFKGQRLEKEKFDDMVDEYYSLRGWDENGVPKKMTFHRFGLASEWDAFKNRAKERNKNV
ncbi:MAG: aldehyde ferredoxin oxidoreductase family protein [Dehalococcoidia bacterium]